MRKTRSQEILTKLANDVVTASIPPGQKLDEQLIARKFSVSRTPVREALRQLSGMGLAEKRPGGGLMAAQIEASQLTEMFETMGELEGICAKFSALRMTEIERHQLRALSETGFKAAESNDVVEYARLNEAFHESIYNGAHNASIKKLTMEFRRRLAPFRIPIISMSEARVESSVLEHKAIVSAIVAADGDESLQAMRRHVASTSASVIDYFERMRSGGPSSSAALGGDVGSASDVQRAAR